MFLRASAGRCCTPWPVGAPAQPGLLGSVLAVFLCLLQALLHPTVLQLAASCPGVPLARPSCCLGLLARATSTAPGSRDRALLPSAAASKKQTAQLRKQSIILSYHFHFKDFLSKRLSGQSFLSFA